MSELDTEVTASPQKPKVQWLKDWGSLIVAGLALVVAFLTYRHYLQRDVPPTPLLKIEAFTDARQELLVESDIALSLQLNEEVAKMRRVLCFDMLEAKDGWGQMLKGSGFIDAKSMESSRNGIEDMRAVLTKTKIHIPFLVRVANNGTRDTTIERCELEFHVYGGRRAVFTHEEKLNIVAPANRVVDLSISGPDRITIPIWSVFPMTVMNMFEGDLDQKVVRSAFEQAAKAHPNTYPIDLEAPCVVTVTDQQGTKYTAEYDARPIREALSQAARSSIEAK